jgi:beta-lactam-binding protein with PASTA domain
MGLFDLWDAPRLSRTVEVPDLVGLLPTDARLAALRAGVVLRIERAEPDPAPTAGIVVRQSPDAGTRVPRGSSVVVVLLHPPR